MSDRLYKIQLPVYLTALFIILSVVEHFFPMPGVVTNFNVTMRSFVTVVSAAAFMLGIIFLTISHAKTITEQKSGWYYNLFYIAALLITIAFGLMGVRNESFLFIYDNMTAPIGAALYSLTAFYITSAAFRVFRARNWNAAILLVCGFIVLTMLIPIGAILLPPVVPIGEWLRSFPSSAGFRGMIMGTSLGVMGLAVRVLTGRQKDHLGIREERMGGE
ncbi:hypothetical protein H8E65_09640 [Candidatus Bathyarchaeota archaeon]|nr:hypothetical protein [Candidatus Bathyarchaeota archaeon]MBL7080475.1 hypothetical protein [Candidatus Bathyarchaeota archaeon]